MKQAKGHFSDPRQGELVGFILQSVRRPFRLHAGDVIRYDGRLCRVLRVNECAAVVLMNRPANLKRVLTSQCGSRHSRPPSESHRNPPLKSLTAAPNENPPGRIHRPPTSKNPHEYPRITLWLSELRLHPQASRRGWRPG